MLGACYRRKYRTRSGKVRSPNPMDVSLFAHARAPNAHRKAGVDWEDFIEEIRTHRVVPQDTDAAKLACPMFSPATFTGERRANNRVEAVHFGVLDLDDIEALRFRSFIASLETRALDFAWFTTWKHGKTPNAVRARLLVPFDRPVPAAQWSAFWPKMVQWLGAADLVDGSCSDPARAYFIPSVPQSRAGWAHFEDFPGNPAPVDEILHTAAPAQLRTKARADSRVLTKPELEALAVRMKRRTAPEDRLAGDGLSKVLEGAPFAEHGARDKTMFAMARVIMREWPNTDTRALAELFRPSVAVMGSDVSLDWVQYKLDRNQERFLEDQEKREQAEADHRGNRIRQALGNGRDWPYSPEEIRAMETRQGFPAGMLPTCWVVQTQSGYYFLTSHGYVGPFSRDQFTPAATTMLAPAPVELFKWNAKGERTLKSRDEILSEYGSQALHTHASFLEDLSTFDYANRTITEATGKRRELAPTFHSEVHRWLRLLAGERWRDLELWLAYLTKLERACSALFLVGDPGLGKSMLFKGLGRLWENEPVPMSEALGNFTESSMRSPLIYADESLPEDFRGRVPTDKLRELVQATERTITRKFKGNAILRGASRVIIVANNAEVLKFDNLTSTDLAAIRERFLYIPGRPEAGEMLRASDTTGWVDGNIIAEHALWIGENAQLPARPPRFLVQSSDNNIDAILTAADASLSGVAQWLVEWALDPEKLRAGQPENSSAHDIFVRQGVLYVSTRALKSHWRRYDTETRPERVNGHTLGKALRSLALGEKVRLRRPCTMGRGTGKLTYVWPIDSAKLISWAERVGWADPAELAHALTQLDDWGK